MKRIAELKRKTKETEINCKINLDGKGLYKVDTGIGFLDHMIEQLSKHSGIDIDLSASGDLHIDAHHTTEDIGYTLGKAISEALLERKGIQRFASAYVPMDETLSRVAVDFGGRPYLSFKAPEKIESIREFSFGLVEEFLRAFSNNAEANIHVEVISGRDAHHIAESIFK